MAIQVIQKLAATPTTVPLPHRVSVDQILSSTKKVERCGIVYSLAEEHDICFEGALKSVERKNVEVFRTATPIEHRLRFVQCIGEERPNEIFLTQDIFDELGLRTRSRVRLTIVRG